MPKPIRSKETHADGSYKKYLLRQKELLKLGLRECTKCRQTREITEFNKCKSKRSGVASWCKLCIKEHRLTTRDRDLLKYRKWHRDNKKHNDRSMKKHREQPCFSKSYVTRINNKDPRYEARYTGDFVYVKCYYCKNLCVPTNLVAQNFLRAKEGLCNIYCSDKCKNKCVEYRFRSNQIDPRSVVYVRPKDAEKVRKCQTDHLKQLQVDELGYNYCENVAKKKII